MSKAGQQIAFRKTALANGYLHKDDEVEGWVVQRCEIPKDADMDTTCPAIKWEETHGTIERWGWARCKKRCEYYSARPATLQEHIDGKAVRS